MEELDNVFKKRLSTLTNSEILLFYEIDDQSQYPDLIANYITNNKHLDEGHLLEAIDEELKNVVFNRFIFSMRKQKYESDE